jgi:hypothetical protein
MTRVGPFGLTWCLIAVLAIAGCGGGDGDDTSTADQVGIPRTVQARANANCRELVREVKRFSGTDLSGYGNHAQAIAEGVIRPGLPILERAASRQQALAAKSRAPALHRYVELFDPMIVLAQESLRVGRSQNIFELRRLNGLLVGLVVEQRQAARTAGLDDCDVNWPDLLLKAGIS